MTQCDDLCSHRLVDFEILVNLGTNVHLLRVLLPVTICQVGDRDFAWITDMQDITLVQDFPEINIQSKTYVT
eukprot:3731929-Amphidinium_carterae.1